ncbi:MAG: sodium:solute symporter [Vicinamibacteria bacterium]|nr:sodium:solute symporter [Vicinamibacteria bacterium]
MSTLDWTVLAVYLTGIVVFGYWVGRNNRKVDDFFLAGRQMPWWAIGLSVMATQISAITFIGTTGQAYGDGMRFLVVYFALPFAMVILCLTLVPFFYRAKVFTAYEYLEQRFDLKTRTITSLLFLLQRGMAVGVTLYAPSLVLSTILGLSESVTILVMGGSTILYVMKGGNRSVIWTDVVQMGIIWIGIFSCLFVAIYRLPDNVSLRGALSIAQTAGRFNAVDLDPSLTKPYTLWGGVIGGLFLMLSYFGCDQSQVQRYLSGSSLTQSKLSLLFNAFLKVPMQFIILLTGILVFVFYQFQPPPALFNSVARTQFEAVRSPEKTRAESRYASAFEIRKKAALDLTANRGPEEASRYLAAQKEFAEARTDVAAVYKESTGVADYNDTNYVFLHYILTQIPHGLLGLIIAVIFAAAMSSLSGEFNSLATASMIDFVRRFRGAGTDERDLFLSRVFTALWGGFACLIALQAGRLGSAIEVVNKFGSYFYGSILGVFMLAVLTKRANGTGASVGLFAGMGVVGLVVTFTRIHFLWWNLVGATTVFVIGYAISLAVPSKVRAS